MPDLHVTLVAGTKLGRYEIRSKLGAGGMGEVYLARDVEIGRDVALKVLPATFSAEKDRLLRFQQEACAAGALNHPNILSIYDVGKHDGSPHLVSELLEGETLRNRIGNTPLSQRRAIDYALQIAHGLAAAHAKGIIHRDLKPDNIFITNDGRVKILDFGLAKLTQVDGDQGQTDIPTRRVDTDLGVVMGTVGYMSPEQLKGRKVDSRSDIFSFGAILYEMLSARRAFHGESAADTMSAILKEDPPELSGVNNTVSPALERLVDHCLEKKPEERFQSVCDVAFALEGISLSSGSFKRQSTAAAVPARSWVARCKSWLVAGVLAALLVAALPFVWLHFNRHVETPQSVRLTIAPPEKGVVSTLSVSPDGRRVVYGAPNAEGKNMLWLRSLDSLTAQALPGTESPFFTTFWSPDSRYVAFVSSSDNKLKKIDLQGGPPQVLANAPNGRGGTWNREGIIVFAPSAEGPLYRISASGGEATQVTTLDESRQDVSHRYPWFLPDGRHFLFLVRGAAADATAIYIGSLDSKETKKLVNAESGGIYSPPGYLLYVRDGSLVAHHFDSDTLEISGEALTVADALVGLDLTSNLGRFSVSENGVLVYYTGIEFDKAQLAWADREGKQLTTLGTPAGYGYLRISPDEKRLAFGRRDPATRWDIWLYELSRDSLTRFTFDAGTELFPIWSPDGTRIAYSSNREAQLHIYEKLSSGVGNDQQLATQPTEPKFVNDWSPDGRYIVYHALSGKTRADLWVLPLFGDRKPFPFLQTQFGEREARFSPNGRWIAYTSDETGPRELFVQSFPAGGGKWQISQGGAGPAEWRADGKELFYVSGDKLMAVDVKTDGDAFEAGTPKALFEIRGPALPGAGGLPAFEASDDGKRFLIAVSVQERSFTPITVVLNWTADLIK